MPPGYARYLPDSGSPGRFWRHSPTRYPRAAWSYKIFSSERFDLLGNSLAILSGLAHPSRARQIITWIEHECRAMKEQDQLVLDLPPNFFPYIQPGDPDWRSRYEEYSLPGEYHNGGVWPFICGFYIAAIVAAGRFRLAEQKLVALTELVRPAREAQVTFGFNEWFCAQDGTPRGQDWQTWSAAMYPYAAQLSRKELPFLTISGPDDELTSYSEFDIRQTLRFNIYHQKQ